MRGHINDTISKLLGRVWMGGMGGLMPPEAVGGSVCFDRKLVDSVIANCMVQAIHATKNVLYQTIRFIFVCPRRPLTFLFTKALF